MLLFVARTYVAKPTEADWCEDPDNSIAHGERGLQCRIAKFPLSAEMLNRAETLKHRIPAEKAQTLNSTESRRNVELR